MKHKATLIGILYYLAIQSNEMRLLFLNLLILAASLSTYAQEKVTEKDILGEWKFIIDVGDEEREEIKEELEDDNLLVQAFAKSISGFVFDVIQGIDIEFHFEENGLLRTYTDVLNQADYERGEWTINEYGGLEFDTDVEFNDSKEKAWFLLDDILVLCDKEGRAVEEEKVYLVRID